ncbi:MAG: DUF134 domain-containing protein [Candidatus Heimdallarchaeota archaeon]|nr:DUF134 domain-containing protein [Candidatus Heimdallarchaeota archaeon]
MVQQRKIPRNCINYEGHIFKPVSIPIKDLEQVKLTKEEITALHYADFLGLKQQEAAEKMGISQASFSRDLASAHHKVAQAFFDVKAILFEEPSDQEGK